MPTVHEIAARVKRALRDGRPLQVTHFPTGCMVAVGHVSLPGTEDKPVAQRPHAHRLSLSFFDPRTRLALTLDPARALAWVELIFGDARRQAFVQHVIQREQRGNREVWCVYVCHEGDKAYMPAYTQAMGDAGVVPYFSLYERQFLAAREALREARKT